eukprot:5529333-Amphidinium_carterae.1
MWWILPIPLSEQRQKLPKITPDKRSDEQVAKWTEARPVGVVGLYVDDTLAGATKAICQGLMSWIKRVWNTGQVEYAGPEDPNTIRFLGLNLDYISKKQSSGDEQEGGVTINQLEYVVETLEKFQSQFQLRTRTSAGDSDSFGKTSELPAQAIKEYDHAVKQGLNGRDSTWQVSLIKSSAVGNQAAMHIIGSSIWDNTSDFAPTGDASQQKKTLVTKSSCEAELLALVSAACRALLNSTHPSFRSRHISRGEWLRQWRQRGVKLSYVSTDRQIADELTKGLTLSPNTLHQLRLVLHPAFLAKGVTPCVCVLLAIQLVKMKTSFDRMQVKAPPSKRSARGSEDARDDSYINALQMIEKGSCSGSSDGSRRHKSGRDDHSWRIDYTEKRSNGWDSDWGSSTSTEERYIPMTIKLKESPEFMKHEEQGFYDVRDMKPIERLKRAWPEHHGKDDIACMRIHTDSSRTAIVYPAIVS